MRVLPNPSMAILSVFLSFLLLSLPLPSIQDLNADRAALLSLRSAVGGRTFRWNIRQTSPCNWAGVKCESNRVTALRLPGVALSGKIPEGIFGNLTQLRTLSLRLNALTGSLPLDLSSCSDLRHIYLQGNRFSGEIPEGLFSLSKLVRLNLAENSFTGEISSGFANLTRLKTLYLEDNQLSGSIPDLDLPLAQFNVSNNSLNGSIPKNLRKFNSDSFLQTSLCGKPLKICPDEETVPSQPTSGGNRTPPTVEESKGKKKDNETVVEVRRTISPYDLTAADNPGAIISHPLLKGANYDEWACGMKTALTSRKKFGFLDGSIPRPDENSPDLEDWKTIQALLVSWIKMTIDPNLRSNISHRDVAKDLWDHLSKRFSVTNGPRIQQIKADLASCKQRGLPIETYYGKLNRIWDSMTNYRPVHVCKCGKCDCDLGTLQEKDREEEKVHDFLCGLDEDYRTVRSTLVSRVPIQSLEEVYNVVRQEEDLKTNVRKREESFEVTAYAAHNKPRVAYPRSDDPNKTAVCKHCHRTGHSSENCFAIIGYPEWWGERSKGRTIQGRGRGGSSQVSSIGRGRNVSYANTVHVPTVSNQEQANYVLTDKDRDGVNGLNETQWTTLVQLLNGGASTSTEKLSGPRFEDDDWSG